MDDKKFAEMMAEHEARAATLKAELAKLGLPDFSDPQAVKAHTDEVIRQTPRIVRIAETSEPEELLGALTRAIDAGEDVNARSPFGNTALKQCFSWGNVEAVRLLIRSGADTTDMQWSPLHLTVVCGEPIDVTADSADVLSRDSVGRTPFLLACRIADVAAAQALLPLTTLEGQVTKPDGEGPLLVSVRSESVHMIDWLLAQGFDVNARDRHGATALTEAAGDDQISIATRLLAAGADVSLGENTSLAFRNREAERGNVIGPYAQAANLIAANKNGLDDSFPDTIQTPASVARSPEMIQLLLQFGSAATEFDHEVAPIAFGTDRLQKVSLTAKQFRREAHPRQGTSNPESVDVPFWREQMRTGHTGYIAQREILGEREFDIDKPIWSFHRFGRTATRLSDGRLVLIAGEHEDTYDRDFCIYADVTVIDKRANLEHYIYPADVFPPTDFHTATLVGDQIYLVGSLGYAGQRREGVTQVLRLDTTDFAIHQVETTGDNPGWISHHTAVLAGRKIVVTGGKVEPGYRENFDTFLFDLDHAFWSKA